MRFTDEQLHAIERRSGELLLDAGAGSGKTAVLVERFARAVIDDGVDPRAILAITFTEKAAAELRERIRARLHELGAEAAARDTEGAWISTIHAFCARVLRGHALLAGVDPAFVVLDEREAAELSAAAFDSAVAAAAAGERGAELIASHRLLELRDAVIAAHDELRSRGLTPELPAVAPIPAPQLDAARESLLAAARALARELGSVPDPPARVVQALAGLERAERVLASADVWPGDLEAIAIPSRNGAGALRSELCDGYREALTAFGELVAADHARRARDALDELVRGYAGRYAALKAERSAVDFEDLELCARDLIARPEVGDRLRARFAHVMVDELQDTNRVQLELIDMVSAGNLFLVGDAQQSIYGFRHAEVELFETRGRRLEQRGARAALQTNFRSRAEVLEPINAAFARALPEGFRPLRPGRADPAAGEPRVELLIVDKGAAWDEIGLAAPWRAAEARALAARVRALIDAGACGLGDVVVLTRATTDLAVYERALESEGVPTYVIGGRGYWSHPQVVELVSYLRALANPLDREPYLATLISPLCGLSLDGLVLVAAGARDELGGEDLDALRAFEEWFEGERRAAPRLGVEALLDRALAHRGYAEAVLRRAGGRRRLANIRKLMRLGREFEAARGTDLRGFVAHLGDGVDRESEAPVESEAMAAVRLMTIHRAKGLEFPCVCVADLGRAPRFGAPLLRLGRDGRRLGLRIGRPGTGPKLPALDYPALRDEQIAAEAAEERRLFYVAMTRAQERLILSGAAKMDTWEKGNRGTPVDWIVPAFVPDVAGRIAEDRIETPEGVRLSFVREDEGRIAIRVAGAGPEPSAASPGPPVHQTGGPAAGVEPAGEPDRARGSVPGPPVPTLSYSALAEYERCAYRFHVERMLGLSGADRSLPPDSVPAGGPARDAALARGTRVHALLQRIDVHRPVIPADAPDDLRELIESLLAGDLGRRLRGAVEVRNEQRFAFLLGATLFTGTFDVLATEPGGLLVVDYKTGGVADYLLQAMIYAVAGLRLGAAGRPVEVIHAFLEADELRATAFAPADLSSLESELQARAAPLLASRFPVSDLPHRRLCAGCPALDGLCSWPAAVALRESADRLF